MSVGESISGEMWNRVPLVVILGSTGVGKSKLSLELSKHFSAEIISADSMQIYKGLDVITNKVTKNERELAPHHMLDFLDPLKTFTVVHFRNMVLPIIKNVHASNKIPIVVGGTNYYIESLLWENLIEDEVTMFRDFKCDAVTAQMLIDELIAWKEYVACFSRERLGSLTETTRQQAIEIITKIVNYSETVLYDAKLLLDSIKNQKTQINIVSVYDTITVDIIQIRVDIHKLLTIVHSELGLKPNMEMKRFQEQINRDLHNKLRAVDPQLASILHHNSTRKILRALQVHDSKGVSQSEMFMIQRSKSGGWERGGPLRFKNAIILWLRCQENVLDERLNDRVDEMVSKGLIQELCDFHSRYNKDRLITTDKNIAYTQGIFQSIGFKEFHSYLILNDEEKRTAEGLKQLTKSIDTLKAVTKRYARRQIKWIKNRFLRSNGREVPLIYSLDTTDLDCWKEQVLRQAIQIVGSHLHLQEYRTDLQPLQRADPLDNKTEANHCHVCNRDFTVTMQWKMHLKSRKHKRCAQKMHKI